MTKSEITDPPRPLAYGKWINLGGFLFLWPFVAIWMLPAIISGMIALAAVEVFWFVTCAWLFLHGLSWLRVDLTANGVTGHRAFGSTSIDWREAQLARDGYWLKVSAPGRVVHINPFVFPDPRQVATYVADRIDSARTEAWRGDL